jgi:hypothetical protein
MPRPRTGDSPQHYLLASEVLPRGLVVAAIRQLGRSGVHTATRVLTISTVRETTATQLLGGDLYTTIGNYLSNRFTTDKTWRVYFPKQLEVVDYDKAYADAVRLLALGFSRQVTCLVLNISDISISRNVQMPVVRGEPGPSTEQDVAVGYEHCVKYHPDRVAELSQYTLGMVGQALTTLRAQ